MTRWTIEYIIYRFCLNTSNAVPLFRCYPISRYILFAFENRCKWCLLSEIYWNISHAEFMGAIGTSTVMNMKSHMCYGVVVVIQFTITPWNAPVKRYTVIGIHVDINGNCIHVRLIGIHGVDARSRTFPYNLALMAEIKPSCFNFISLLFPWRPSTSHIECACLCSLYMTFYT